ncbi:MAG: vWA domain-containing protein [bacterium]
MIDSESLQDKIDDRSLNTFVDELDKDLDFFLPDAYDNILKETDLSKEIISIFYIARVIFNPLSRHKIKRDLSQLWKKKRKQFMLDHEQAKSELAETSLGNYFDLKKIKRLGQISRVLPRDFLIFPDQVFYNKLISRQLYVKSFDDPEEKNISVAELVKGPQEKLNRSQKLYFLFDNSTSMSTDNINKFFTAKAIALEYLRKVAPESPQIYFRTFHSELGPLVKTRTTKDINDLIRYILNLTTGGGHITIIGEAILTAINEIQTDPELEDAEILVITDGCGPMRDEISSRGKNIKINVILIPDTDVEKILKIYPSREAWDAVDTDQREMPEFWIYYGNCRFAAAIPDENYVNALRRENGKLKSKEITQLELLICIGQIYNIEEEADLFLLISSILGEKFLFNPEELQVIKKYRLHLKLQLENGIPGKKMLIILRKVTFLIEYLKIAKEKECSQDVFKAISQEIEKLTLLQNNILNDPWIVSIRSDSQPKKKKSVEYSEELAFAVLKNEIKKLINRIINLYLKIFKR